MNGIFYLRRTLKHFCPTKAACWSPRHPAIGTFKNGHVLYFIVPKFSAEEQMFAKILGFIPKKEHNSLSHFNVFIFMSIVRDAFVTSVTYFSPSVRFQISQVSIVPTIKRSSFSAFCTSLLLSNNQRSWE